MARYESFEVHFSNGVLPPTATDCGRRGGAAEGEAATAAAAAAGSVTQLSPLLTTTTTASERGLQFGAQCFSTLPGATHSERPEPEPLASILPNHYVYCSCFSISFSLPLLLRSQFPLPSYFVLLLPIYLRRRSREGGREGGRIAIASVHVVVVRQVAAL